MVKKIIAIVAIVIGALMVVSGVAPMIIGAILEAQRASTVGIIGGADGPTAVMVTGVSGTGSVTLEILAGVILIFAGAFILRKFRKK